MYNNQAALATHMTIDRLILAKTGQFHPQYRRAYETVATGEAINGIGATLEQAAMVPGHVTPMMLGGSAAAFLQPSSQVESQIHIDNGWNTQRFYFFMEVSFISPVGRTRQLVQGWTDHAGVSFSGALDPNMVFTINSTTVLKTRQERVAGGGMVEVPVIGESQHVLTDTRYGGFESIANNSDKLLTMRPGDLFVNMSMKATNPEYVDPAVTMNTRNIVTGAPKASNRKFALPTEYTARVLSGYGQSMSQNPWGVTPEAQLFASAAALTGDGTFLQNKFMGALQRVKQMGANNYAESFTYGELCRLDATLDNRTILALGSEGLRETTVESPFHRNGLDTQHMGGKAMTDVAASMISSSVPGLLVIHGLSQLSFMVSNRHKHTNQFMPGTFSDVFGNNFWIYNALGITEGLDVTQSMQDALLRFCHEMFWPISQYGQQSCEITVTCDLFNATSISIFLEGVGYPVEYMAPTFADALTVPIVTNSNDRVNQLAQDFQNLVEVVHQTDASTNFNAPFNPDPTRYGGI